MNSIITVCMGKESFCLYQVTPGDDTMWVRNRRGRYGHAGAVNYFRRASDERRGAIGKNKHYSSSPDARIQQLERRKK